MDDDDEDQARRVDRHAGARLRVRRGQLRRSQARLGQAIGVSAQQVQKYERGANRLTATRLHALSEALGAPIGYFFEGLDAAAGDELDRSGGGASDLRDFCGAPDGVDWAIAVTALRSPRRRREILKLVKALAEAG